MNENNESKSMASVNLNEKSKYISFTSPILKNKKGHSRQMTKGINRIKTEDGSIDWNKVSSYIEEIKYLLSDFDKYSADYNSYLEAKNKFSKFSMDCVFEGSEFSNKYDQDATKRILDKIIPIYHENAQYFLPSVLFTGVSAGGKTTTLRQVIGSSNTSFPATMQANTTVGTFHVVVMNEIDKLSGIARFTTKAALEERIRYALSDIVKKVLTEDNAPGSKVKDIYDLLFDSLTIFDDRKCKLQYIISKNHLVNEKLGEITKEASTYIWDQFKREFKKNESDLIIYNEFPKNSSSQFFTEFGEYIVESLQENDENNKLNQLFDSVMSLIINNVNNTIRIMITKLFCIEMNAKLIDRKILITDENKVHEFVDLETFTEEKIVQIKYPKMISIEISYRDKSKPDTELRKNFFEIMEHISSADEKNICKTLFPIIDEMRMQGNFRPLWKSNSEKIEDYILVDSEGLGHDMSKDGVSIDLRNVISECRKIVFIQNGSEAISDQFADALGLLISTGSIYKTSFCFNRMEKFDLNSNNSIESRITFIKSGIVNSIKKIVEDEENHSDKIVAGKEHVFEELVINNSLYFEYLSEVIENEEGILPAFNKPAFEILNQQLIKSSEENNVMAISTFQNAKNTLLIKFNEVFNSVKNIDNLVTSFVTENDILFERITEIGFEPHYSLYKFTKLFIKMNEEFSESFINKINGQLWQTVKAFNSRIAYNYDSREWSNLRPESEFIGYAQKKIISFLLNPENIDVDSQIKDKALFVEVISNMMSNYLSKEFRKIAEIVIYEELLNDCWEPGIKKSGTGSTYERKRIIHQIFNRKFDSDVETDKMFKRFKQIVFGNDLMKLIKYKHI